MSSHMTSRNAFSKRVTVSQFIAIAMTACLLAFGTTAFAAESTTGRNIDLPNEPVFLELPGTEDPKIRRLWQEGIKLEEAGDFLASIACYQEIADRLKTSPYPFWRMARNYWHHSKTFPKDAKDEQIHFLELSDRTADLGLELDEECAECMLWKYAALGRLPTVRGLLSGGADAKTMAKLIERGIEITSNDATARSQATLANFYYASASFYRMVPDWFWLRWVFGVQGNKERALSDARKAVALAESRLDYKVELGAALLCYGATQERPESTQEGIELLTRVQSLAPSLPTDAPDQELAHVLIQSPGRACEFSRAGFLDVESVAAAKDD